MVTKRSKNPPQVWLGLYACFQGSMKDVCREAMGLIRFTPKNIMKSHCGGRNQIYRWINDVEYTYGNNGRCELQLNVVVCEESWMN